MEELNPKGTWDSKLRTDLKETIQPQKPGKTSKEIPSFLTIRLRKAGTPSLKKPPEREHKEGKDRNYHCKKREMGQGLLL